MFVSRKSLRRLLFALALPSLTCVAALAAAPITGTVTNATTGKPSSGDTVVLIRLAQGMQEATRTTTDAHGNYTLEVPDDGLHLVRVTHDLANYFQPAPPGTSHVDLTVYNAAAHVKGVSTEADVMRIQSDASGTGLTVVENFFVKNDSHPALTQFSKEPFDFYLPEGAIVEGSAALAPGGMPVQAAPVPLADKGHFTFLFPIRPGETRFQISYRIPYSGSFHFAPHLSAPVDTIAIMLPKSMTFTPAAGSPYTPITDEVNAQTFVARSVTLQQPLGFTLAGTGQLPRDTQNPDASQNSQASTSATDGPNSAEDNTQPGKGLDNPLNPSGNRDPWAKYKWWILAGLGLLMAGAAGALLRKPASYATATGASPAGGGLPGSPLAAPLAYGAAAAPASPAAHQAQLLTVLKEELFALETERLQNRLTEPEYLEQKAALETVLRRALGRTAPAPTATEPATLTGASA